VGDKIYLFWSVVKILLLAYRRNFSGYKFVFLTRERNECLLNCEKYLGGESDSKNATTAVAEFAKRRLVLGMGMAFALAVLFVCGRGHDRSNILLN
jgi:hypothetical protein